MRFVNHLLTLDISSTDSLLSLISLVIIISFCFSFPNYIYVSNDDQPTKSHLSRVPFPFKIRLFETIEQYVFHGD